MRAADPKPFALYPRNPGGFGDPGRLALPTPALKVGHNPAEPSPMAGSCKLSLLKWRGFNISHSLQFPTSLWADIKSQ